MRHEGMAEKEAMGIPEPGDVPSSRVISSTRVELAGGHARLSVWNRGGLAGVLVLEGRDVELVRGRLEGNGGALEVAGEGFDKAQDRLVALLAEMDPIAMPNTCGELADLITTLGDESACAWRAARGVAPTLEQRRVPLEDRGAA